MANNFCRRLSNSARFISNGEGGLVYQPCCWVPTSSVDIRDRKTIMMARDEITSMVMSDTEHYCAECMLRERNGHNLSHRMTGNRMVPADAEDHDIYELVVQADNTCNAACVMCGPQFSSLWHKQFDPSYKPKDFTAEYDIILNNVDLDKVREITMLGGEPFLSDQNFRLLAAIPNPELVKLHFSTNGSVFPSAEKIEMISRFKKILLGFSLDGTGEQFEYIRWPLKWSKIDDNVRRFRELFDSGVWRGGQSVNFTTNPMNILHLKDVEEWFKPYSDDSNWKPVYASICFGDWGLDATPQPLRVWLEENLGADHFLTGMVRAYPERPGKWEQLRERMRELDWTRGTSAETVFARTLSIIEK